MSSPKTHRRSKKRKLEKSVQPLDADEQQCQVIKLNVGGFHFVTFRSTLIYHQNSYFSTRFGGKFEDGPVVDGEYFIDRNGKQFEVILEYLRNGEDVVLPSSMTELKKLKLEARFYNLTKLLKLIEDDIAHLQYTDKWSLSKTQKVMLYLGERIAKLSQITNAAGADGCGIYDQFETGMDLVFDPEDDVYDIGP